jgi:hypothetical protein
LLWLALATRSKYLGAGSYRLARRNVLIEFISTTNKIRAASGDNDWTGLLSFCHECGSTKNIV